MISPLRRVGHVVSSAALAPLVVSCGLFSSSEPPPLPPSPYVKTSPASPASATGAQDDSLSYLEAEIRAADLEAHVRFLAADRLRGRYTGSLESLEAAQYAAGLFARLRLEPAGDEGSYLQRVPLARYVHTAPPRLSGIAKDGTARSAVYGVDFDRFEPGEATASLRVVRYNGEGPLPAPSAEVALFLDGAFREQREWLNGGQRPGGVGFGLIITRGFGKEGRGPPGRLPRARTRLEEPGGRGPPSVQVRGAWIEELRRGEIVRVRFDSGARREVVTAYNVAARIPGRGSEARPELEQEVLVLSAHYDHLGWIEEVSGDQGAAEDRIYNGADDDASGCAAVLELAHALKEAPPARTILCLLFTAEEFGRLGSRHFAAHPTLPLDSIVANLNFEMIGRPDPKIGGAGRLWLTGFERTNLGAAFAPLGVAPDPYPEQRFFGRSDDFSFVDRGIVGQALSSFNLHDDYHQVTDEAHTLDYRHMEAAVQMAFEAVRLVAEGEVDPEWLPGGLPPVADGD